MDQKSWGEEKLTINLLVYLLSIEWERRHIGNTWRECRTVDTKTFEVLASEGLRESLVVLLAIEIIVYLDPDLCQSINLGVPNLFYYLLDNTVPSSYIS